METCSELETHINRYIKLGWKPIGGIGIKHSNPLNDTIFYQAIVKTNKKFSFGK